MTIYVSQVKLGISNYNGHVTHASKI